MAWNESALMEIRVVIERYQLTTKEVLVVVIFATGHKTSILTLLQDYVAGKGPAFEALPHARLPQAA